MANKDRAAITRILMKLGWQKYEGKNGVVLMVLCVVLKGHNFRMARRQYEWQDVEPLIYMVILFLLPFLPYFKDLYKECELLW